jgi:adenylate kinase
LDGFPRTLAQAKALDKVLKVDHVLAIDVPNDVVIKRLGGRYTCEKCKDVFNRRWQNIETGICPQCGGKLFQREDDKEAVIQKRLKNFGENNPDILDFYKKQDKLILVHVKEETVPQEVYKMFKGKLNAAIK